MGPLKNPSSTQANSLQMTSRAAIKLLLLALVIVVVPLALVQRVKSTSQPAQPVASVPAVMIHAAGRGKPYLNLQDGRKMGIDYRGDSALAEALRVGSAQPRALASADFDRNGTPDVVAGYALNGTGLITIQRGNPDAFAPADDSVFVRMQQGYNPASLLPVADIYALPVPVDFLVTGNFSTDSVNDVLVAVKGGGLYLLTGDGTGRFGVPSQVTLPGAVTALAAGEFRAADGITDVAVGVSGPDGETLLIFDGATSSLSEPFVQYQLNAPATAVEFGGLDQDPFLDVAVANGSEVLVVHGWGRKENVTPASRLERINVAPGITGLAIGAFQWDRKGLSEIAALTTDGVVHVVSDEQLDTRPFTEAEAAERNRGRLLLKGTARDIETVQSWRSANAGGWRTSSTLTASSFGAATASQKPLLKTNLSYRETEDLMVVDGSQRKIGIMRQMAPAEKAMMKGSGAEDVMRTSLDVESAPVAVLPLPRKLNGARDVVVLDSATGDMIIVENAANTTITVDRTDDTLAAGATVCDNIGNNNNCSLRGALQYANNPANNNTTINIPANTYILSINGASVNGCSDNTTGDLSANQTMSIIGAGAATTIIRQTGTGPANDGDRIMCMNENFLLNLVYNFSGVTFSGGRDGDSNGGTPDVFGGGGIIGGEKDNSLTLTSVTFVNNQATQTGLGGGGLQITGGNLNIVNCTFGGTSAPVAYTDRVSVTGANSTGTSGGGLAYTPSAPQHTGGTGTLTVTGTTFSRNVANSVSAGGGGADLVIFAFGAPGGIGSGSASFSTSTFTNNSATSANGGGIVVESLPTTVASTSFNNNSAGNRGGAIYLGGGSLLLNGTTPSITMSGNTATNAGSSVSTSAPVNVSGTNTTIGGSIEVAQNGTWTNNAGSALSPTDVAIPGGTFNMNDSTMNVSGNFTIGPGGTVGGTFNGNTGTVNILGNFTLTAGGAPATSFNGGTGTFNFNGTGSQSITSGVSPTFGNLTDSNINNPLAINGNIAVTGNLTANANTILAPSAATVISGSGTLTGFGTARVTRTGANAFLSQYTLTNKTLTNLTVEYIGAGAQGVSPTTYGHLKINNPSGVSLDSGTTTVNGTFTLTAGQLNVGNSPRTLVLNNGTTVVGGTLTSGADGTVNYNQSSDGQAVIAATYGHLTFSNFNKVLAGTGTIFVAGTFTPGTATGHTIAGSTINFNGTGAQTIPAFNYFNLSTASARGANNITLVNGGTISIAGAFSPLATFAGGGYVITNNTVNYNGATAQTIAAFNYNNLTSSNVGARTLQNGGTIGIAGVFTPGASSYTVTNSTVNFNGTGAQTIPAFNYNNLSSSSTGARTLPNTGTIGIAGAFAPGSNAYTITGSTINYNGAGSQTIAAFNYNNLTSSNSGARTLANSGTIGVAEAFTPGTNAYTITLSTINFNGTGAQAVPAFNYNNLTISGARGVNNVTLANSGIIGIAGLFSPTATFAGGSIVITGSTIEYNGTSAQTMPAGFTTYNNLNLNNPAGVTGFAGLTVQGLLNVKAGTFTSSSFYNNVQIDSGATMAATAASTINVTGNWTNNGTFNGSTGTVAFNGSAAQAIGGSAVTAFTNLTIANNAGVSLNQNATVNGTLTLNSDLATGANTLSQPGTAPASAGAFDVVGNARRTGTPLPTAVAMTFGNLNNIITFNAVGTTPNDVTINLVKSAPAAFPSAVQRTYTITPNGGAGFSGTLRLRYLDAELNGNIESQLDLWRFNGSSFIDEQQTSRDAVNNWVQKTGVTTFSPWTFATHVNAAPSVTAATTVVNAQTTSGLVITAAAIDGATVTHFKITGITGGSLFKNDGVTAIANNDFITLAEGNAGLKFTPTPNSIAAGSFSAQASSDATGTGLSAAGTGAITVNQGSTTTTITLDSPDPSGTGAAVTVNFSVAVELPSSGTPSGNVIITVNDASGDTCNGNLTGGAGTCNLTLTTAGSKTLTATYGGDTLFIGGLDTEPHVVNGPPVAVDDNYSSLKASPLNVAAPGVLANDTGTPTEVTAIAAGPTTAGGTVTLNTNGSFTYNPPTAVFTGADSFTYTANNAFGSDSGTVNISVVEAFFINEILFDPPGTDAPNEYIELRGPASSTIPAGTYLVAIEGDSAENPGDVQTIINLSGLSFGSNGFLVLLQNGNTYTTAAGTTVLTSTTAGFGGLPGAIFSADAAATDLEDSSVSFLLIQTVTAPTLTDDIDTDDNGSPNAPYSGWTLLDSIGALNAGANVRGYAAYHYRNTAGTGSTIGAETIVNFIPSYLGRNGDSIGATAADWVSSAGLAGTAPNFTLSATNTEPIAFASQPLNHIGATNFDISPPTVTSITRASANPTNAASVDFTVTFSENVTGVDAADFALTTTGSIAGASVGLIGAVGNVFTVTVNTGTGDGTIRLDLIDNNTIIDGSNNPLGGAGVQSFTTGEVYTIDKTVPTVNIVDVTPDPRSTSVSSISIVFSEAITGFDLADLSLTRNGGSNLLTGSQTLTSADNITWTLGNLSSITTSDGTYVLTLTAAGSSIADGAGNALAANASDTWLMDGNAPTVDITDVSPDPRNSAVGSIAIVFSEAITGFDLADLSLTRDGGANLLTGAQTLTSGDNINWSLGNLTGLTGTSGTYTLTLTAPGGIQDGSANALAAGGTDSWVTDTSAPTVNIVDVTPDPRNTSVTSISIVFSEAVTGFDLADLSLTRDGGANLLTGSQTLTSGDNITWTLGNLSTLTGADGNYALTLTSGGIADNAGNALAAGASDTWVVNGAPPTVDITDVSPDPRNATVSSIAIVFSEAISGFDMGDLSLTRNGGANLLGGGQTLTSGDNINWTLGNLAGLTGTDGTYTLTLTAPGGITDAGGASLSGGATDSWVMDATGPSVTINQASGQADPTSASPINFTVVFNEPVANFVTGDVALSGTAGATTGTVTETAPNNGTTYNVAVSGMTSSGTVIAAINAGMASDALGNLSQASTSTDNTVTFNLITNNAPVLDIAGNFSLNAIDEDISNASNTGTLISGIIASAGGDRITDADAGAMEGIAITGVDSPNGTWEFSINNGLNWTSIGTPDPAAALLLVSDANTRLRFIPNANFNGTVTSGILFRAWDQTSGTNGGTADTTTNGGQTAFSASTDTASITVNAVNDPPSFTKGADQVVGEDAGAQTVPGWATNILAGPADESGQTLTFLVTTNNDSLFAVLPAISSTGTLTYTPAANASGVITVFVALKDNGGGTETSAVQTFTITINAVNDTPTANAQSVNTNEDTQLGITLTGSDAETPSGSLIFTVTVLPTNGVLSGSGPNRTYTPNAGYNGPDSFKFTVTDPGTPALTSAEATVSITVDAVNDGPTNTVPGAQVTNTNTALTFSAGNGNQISIADSDAGVAAVQVTLTATNGTVTLSTAGGLIFSVGDSTAEATMTFSGSVANINNALNGLAFTPTSGFSGAASLQIVTNDLGNTGSGGALSDTDSVNITVTSGGTLQFSSATYTVAENGGSATITITRSGGTAGTATVLFETSNGNADSGDYTTVSQTVTFLNGETSKTVDVPITNDGDPEPDQTVNLTLSNPGGTGILGSPATAVLTITNDDIGGALQFSSATYSVAENAGPAVITISRTGGSAGTATVLFETSNGTADSGDYTTVSQTVTFLNGETSKTVNVPIINDTNPEPDQTVTLTLSNAGGTGTLGTPATAVLTITNDDIGGALQFSAATYTVAEDGGSATITVNRNGGSGGTTTVDFATSNGTATAGVTEDYTATSGTLTFGNGVTSQTFSVPILNDPTDEANETVNLTLSNVTGGGSLGAQSTAVLTITDNDPPLFSFNASTFTVGEGDLRVSVTVNRAGDLSQPIKVNYATGDSSALNACSQVTGNASQRCDYATVVGTLRFAAGESSKVINIPIVDDIYIEGSEVFTVALTNATGGGLGTPVSATVTITDNDVAPVGPNPITNDAFWLRQMYIDILGREPEPGAVNAWLAILNNCTPATNCDRTAVALGFLKSVEFQGRGFFAYRFYAASLGRPAVYPEFVPDHARFSGFLSPADLELNKQDYVTDFMNRAEFKAIYDPTIGNNTHYVDTLLQRAGLPNHPQRAAWITGLNNTTLTRGAVLRQLVESNEVYFKFLNEGFVVMNYFGLLRRTADAQYLVWIQILNQTGDERGIVTGFINSPEYRLRFGPN